MPKNIPAILLCYFIMHKNRISFKQKISIVFQNIKVVPHINYVRDYFYIWYVSPILPAVLIFCNDSVANARAA